MRKLSLMLLAAVCAPALAQSDVTFMPEGSHDIYLSATAALVRRSEGARGMRLVVLPGATVEWSNGVYLEPGELGMRFASDANLQYGPMLAYGVKNERRDEPGAKTRLDLEPGAFVSYQLLYNLNLHSRVLYGGSDDNRGVRLDLGATFSTPVAPHQGVSLSVGADMADHTYMQSYFGLTAQQARRDGLPQYHAAAGLKDLYLSGSWQVELSNKYSLNTGVAWSRLRGSAAASPLTTDPSGYALFTTLNYHY